MTTAEVSDLTRQIDIAALRDYRDAVGRRTREIVSGFKDTDWEGELTVQAVERAAAEGRSAPAPSRSSRSSPAARAPRC